MSAKLERAVIVFFSNLSKFVNGNIYNRFDLLIFQSIFLQQRHHHYSYRVKKSSSGSLGVGVYDVVCSLQHWDCCFRILAVLSSFLYDMA